MLAIKFLLLRHLEISFWVKCWNVWKPCRSPYAVPLSGSLLPPFSAGIKDREWRRRMYCGRRNQSNLSLNSCEPVQPAVLRLRLPPSVFILKQLFLSNLCSTCTSPSFYLLPPPKELFRQVFCFVSVRISREPSTQASELIYRNALMCERGGVDFSCIYGEKTKKKLG